jgi:hypothetical protein
MALTHFDLKNARPDTKPCKLFDGGGSFSRHSAQRPQVLVRHSLSGPVEVSGLTVEPNPICAAQYESTILGSARAERS